MKIPTANKTLISIFTAFLVSIVFSGVTFAADLKITCDLDSCSDFGGGKFCSVDPFSGAPLFNESKMLPGHSITRTLEVSNIGDCDCGELNFTTSNVSYARKAPLEIFSPIPGDISKKFFTVIKSESTDYYGLRNGSNAASDTKSLYDLFNESVVPLGSLSSDTSKIFEWVVTFDSQTGNDYQGVSTKFDFSVEFKCGSGDGDGNGDGDGDGDGVSGGIDGGTGGAGIVAGIATQLGFGGPPQTFEEVAGTAAPTTPEPEIILPGDEGAGKVKGISACVDPKFWWLLFIVQFLLCYIFYKRVNQQNMDKKKQHFFIQILNDLVFMFIFWKYFCPWWDVLVSALIGVFWFTLLKRKIDKLHEYQHLKMSS